MLTKMKTSAHAICCIYLLALSTIVSVEAYSEEQSDLDPHCLSKMLLKHSEEDKADVCCDWGFLKGLTLNTGNQNWTNLKCSSRFCGAKKS